MESGIFEHKIELPIPDLKAREEILCIVSKDKKIAGDVNFHPIAEKTTGFTGADLLELINKALMEAAFNNKPEATTAEIESVLTQIIQNA